MKTGDSSSGVYAELMLLSLAMGCAGIYLKKKEKTDKAAENLRNAQKRQWREKSRCCFFDGLGVLPGNFKLMWFNKVNGNNYCKKKIECDPFFT